MLTWGAGALSARTRTLLALVLFAAADRSSLQLAAPWAGAYIAQPMLTHG